MDDFTTRIMERARNRANLCQSSVAAVESLSSRQQQQQQQQHHGVGDSGEVKTQREPEVTCDVVKSGAGGDKENYQPTAVKTAAAASPVKITAAAGPVKTSAAASPVKTAAAASPVKTAAAGVTSTNSRGLLHSTTKQKLAMLSKRYNDADNNNSDIDELDTPPATAASAVTPAATTTAAVAAAVSSVCAEQPPAVTGDGSGSGGGGGVAQSLRHRLATLGSRLHQMEEQDQHHDSQRKHTASTSSSVGAAAAGDSGAASGRSPTRWSVRSPSPLRRQIAPSARPADSDVAPGDRAGRSPVRQANGRAANAAAASNNTGECGRHEQRADKTADDQLRRSLESRGYTSTSSGSCLVYDFSAAAATAGGGGDGDNDCRTVTQKPPASGERDKEEQQQQQRSPYRSTSPVRHISPTATRQKSPVRHTSPVRQQSPVRHTSPVRQQSPVRHTSPVPQQSPVRHTSPVRQQSQLRHASPVRQQSPVRHTSPVRGRLVQERAALFDRAGPGGAGEGAQSPAVDPAHLSLAERRKLFETGQPPKVLARFGTPVTPAMLQKQVSADTENQRKQHQQQLQPKQHQQQLQPKQHQQQQQPKQHQQQQQPKQQQKPVSSSAVAAVGEGRVAAGRLLWQRHADDNDCDDNNSDEPMAGAQSADKSGTPQLQQQQQQCTGSDARGRASSRTNNSSQYLPVSSTAAAAAKSPAPPVPAATGCDQLLHPPQPPTVAAAAGGAVTSMVTSDAAAPTSGYQVRVKPGCLYPCLSDIETPQNSLNGNGCEEQSDCSFSGVESLGTCIQQLARRSVGPPVTGASTTLHNIDETPYDDTEMRGALDVSASLEDVLSRVDQHSRPAIAAADDQHLCDESPAKRSKTTNESPPSFRTPLVSCVGSPRREDRAAAAAAAAVVVDSDNAELPLLHSVSFYRKQKPQEVVVTPVKRSHRHTADTGNTKYPAPPVPAADTALHHHHQQQQQQARTQELVHCLHAEVEKQQQVMSQASNALLVFDQRQQQQHSHHGLLSQHEGPTAAAAAVASGQLAAMIEAERLLLVAGHRRQAAISELQRLRAEGAMQRSGIEGATSDAGRLDGVPVVRGSLSFSCLCLPLKSSFVRQVAAGDADAVHHFICLLRYRGQVTASELLASSDSIKGGAINFPNLVTFADLEPDFSVAVEVYALTTPALAQQRPPVAAGDSCTRSKLRKDSRCKTPKKAKKTAASSSGSSSAAAAGAAAAGGGGVVGRASNFHLLGFVHVTARAVTAACQQHAAGGASASGGGGSNVSWNLERVSYEGVLEGVLLARCSLQTAAATASAGRYQPPLPPSSAAAAGAAVGVAAGDALCTFVTLFDDVQGLGSWQRRWCRLDAAGSGQLLFWKYPECEERQLPPLHRLQLASCVVATPPAGAGVQLVPREVCARPHTLLVETVRRRRAGDELESLVLKPQPDGRTTHVKNLLSFDSKDECFLWRDRMNATLAYLRAWDSQPLVTN